MKTHSLLLTELEIESISASNARASWGMLSSFPDRLVRCHMMPVLWVSFPSSHPAPRPVWSSLSIGNASRPSLWCLALQCLDTPSVRLLAGPATRTRAHASRAPANRRSRCLSPRCLIAYSHNSHPPPTHPPPPISSTHSHCLVQCTNISSTHPSAQSRPCL